MKYKYRFSEILNQWIAINIKTGDAYYKDGTVYLKKELKIARGMTLKTHNVKKVFEGIIVNCI